MSGIRWSGTTEHKLTQLPTKNCKELYYAEVACDARRREEMDSERSGIDLD